MIIDIVLVDDPRYSTQPYLDLAYVRASMNQCGAETKIHFVPPSQQDSSCQLVIENRTPDIIVATFAYPEVRDMMKILADVKLRYPSVIICVASSLVNRFYRKMMQDFQFIDIAVLGEPDETCLNLCQHIMENRPFLDCKGIAYRDVASGEIIVNESRPYIRDLDSLPFPDRSHQREAGFKLEYINIKKNRGCTGTCTFCKDNAYRNRQPGAYFRMRSVKNTIDEIEMLYEKHNKREFKFFFGDYCLFDGGEQGLESCRQLFKQLAQKHLGLVLHCQSRAELIVPHAIPMLKQAQKAGLATILIGLESANDCELKLYGKKATVEDNDRAIAILKELGITLIPSFITFNHFSSYETVKNNFDYIHKNGYSHNMGWFRTYLELHPETAFTDILVKHGLLDKDYDYLNIRDEARWRDERMKGLLEALHCIPLDSQMQRNSMRMERMKNVVEHRFNTEHQQLFQPLIVQYDQYCKELQERNYAMATQCFNMVWDGQPIQDVKRLCEAYRLDDYYEPFQKLKMQMEVRFERMRKFLIY